jgi:hypothetical protein
VGCGVQAISAAARRAVPERARARAMTRRGCRRGVSVNMEGA